MIPIYVCEDNAAHRAKITECVENYILMENLDMKVVLSTENPRDIINHLQNDTTMGIYLLDVDLQCDINGIQLASKIREFDPRGFIVFITTHAEALPFTFEYKVEALDYIIKDAITGVNARICECLDSISKRITKRPDAVMRFSFRILDNKIITVDYDNVLFFETSPATPRKVVLHAFDSRYEFYAKLEDILKKLDVSFFRCHKSYIVNTKNIKEIDMAGKEIIMKDGSRCFISIRQLSKLKELMHI